MLSKVILEQIQELTQKGFNNNQIANKLNISRYSVRKWKNKTIPLNLQIIDEFNPDNITSLIDYSYILGLYLGDGYINKMKRTYRLRIFQTSKYIRLIDECKNSLEILFPHNKVSIYTDGNTPHCSVINVYNSLLPEYFPQFGKKKKNERTIMLTEWQQSIINKYPNQFLKGLFDSDGSRYITNNYVRYNFTNKSNDIINMCEKSLDLIGIKYKTYYTKDNIYRVCVTKKQEVMKLDEFINKKS